MDQHIQGGAELQKFLSELPVNIEKNIVRGGLRAGGQVIEKAIQDRIPVDEGDLKESLRVTAGAKKGGRVYAHVKTGGPKARHAHLVEFGTKPHEIRPKGAISLFFAGVFSKLIQHPGAKPQPFMRPGFDSSAGRAVQAIGEYIGTRVEKLKAKAGRNGTA